jgi:Major Facilitator Superfamily
MLNYIGYTIVTIQYPDKKQAYLGFCSTARGLGCTLGPLMGQAIYNALKFEVTFYTFAAIITPFALLAFLWIPSSINQLKNPEENTGEKGPVTQITYGRMLLNLRAMLSLIAAIITLILTLFFDGTLANHLIDIGIDESLVGKFNVTN